MLLLLTLTLRFFRRVSRSFFFVSLRVRRREGLVVLSYIWCVFPPPSPSPPRLARPVESLLQTRCWGHGARFFRGFFSFSLAGFSLGLVGRACLVLVPCGYLLMGSCIVPQALLSVSRFCRVAGAVRCGGWFVSCFFLQMCTHAHTAGSRTLYCCGWLINTEGREERVCVEPFRFGGVVGTEVKGVT